MEWQTTNFSENFGQSLLVCLLIISYKVRGIIEKGIRHGEKVGKIFIRRNSDDD